MGPKSSGFCPLAQMMNRLWQTWLISAFRKPLPASYGMPR
jgi:hypothetical protein